MKKIIVVCSTAHLSETDNHYLKFLAITEEQHPWVFNTVYGFIIDLTSLSYPFLSMKRCGVSKSLRKFILHQQNNHLASYIHFDCDGKVLAGEQIYMVMFVADPVIGCRITSTV